jgi:hypothetical protein
MAKGGFMFKPLGVPVHVDAATITSCWEHADAIADARGAAYAARGGFKLRDGFNGKLAEFAAFKLLRERSFDVAPPDVEVGRGHRAYEADIPLVDAGDGARVGGGWSVKATTFLRDKSWVFQKEDHFSLRRCPDDEFRQGILASFKALPDNFVPIQGHVVEIDWCISLPIPDEVRGELRNGVTNKIAVYDSALRAALN